MALIPQNDAGTVVGANSYGDLAFLTAYWDERGYAYPKVTAGPPAVTQDDVDAKISAAGVIATDYMDGRWTYVGERVNGDQTTEFPRRDDARLVYGVALPVKQAWAEYTLIVANGGSLEGTPERDATGARVISKFEKVGSIAQSVEFASGGAYVKPQWPAADNILKKRGLVQTGGRIYRG